MSISLNVEKYCEDCTDFEADVDKIEIDEFDGSVRCITTVECKNKDRCASIYYYLLKHTEKKGEKGESADY